MMSSRTSMNGMGVFEGSPEAKVTPFVMFNRVQLRAAGAPPAWGRRRQRTLRARVVGEGVKFEPAEIPQISTGVYQKFKAIGKKPLPGDYPGSILPYGRPGWAYVEPYSSAEGLGEEKSTWGAITDIVKTVSEKAKEFAPVVKNIREIFKKPKAAQTTPPPPQAPPPRKEEPKDNTMIYLAVGGSVLLIGGLVTFLVLKR